MCEDVCSRLTTEEQGRIERAFCSIDKDADGMIGVLELKAALEALDLEAKPEELWELLSTVEQIKIETGRFMACIDIKEFSRIVAEKMRLDSSQEDSSSGSGGVTANVSPLRASDMTTRMANALEAASRRSQTIAEQHMQVLQSQVLHQVEDLVSRLHDEHATALREIRASISPTDVDPLGEVWAPPRKLSSPNPPEIEPTQLRTSVVLPRYTSEDAPPELQAAAPSWESASPKSLRAVEDPTARSQMLLPGGVPENGSLGGDAESPTASCPITKTLATKRHRTGSIAASSTGLRRQSTSAHLAAAEAIQKCIRARGKSTLRQEAFDASLKVLEGNPGDSDDENGSDMGNVQRLQEEKDVNRQLFVDAATLKERVRRALIKHKYNVKDHYKTTGIPQQVAKSTYFEYVTLAVVVVNSIWIWVDADLNPEPVLAQSSAIFQVMENGFCVYFVFEWLIRFLSFQWTKSALRDTWFVFDTILVILTVIDTWVLSLVYVLSTAAANGAYSLGMDPDVLKLFRMMRLTRMARMARLLRWMPALLIILKGIFIAGKSVMFTLLLLFFTIFVFGITFRQLTADTPVGELYFSSVHGSMLSLFLHGTLPDLAEMVKALGTAHVGLGVLLVIFIVIATLTIMNMLVGILVEVVSTVSTIENETLMVNMVRAKMLQMIEVLGLDLDGNGYLSRMEYESLLVLPEAAQFIQEVGVDVVGLVEYSDFIFKDREMSFSDFVELILQLRGTNTATVKDIVDLRKQVMQGMENHFKYVFDRLDSIYEMLGAKEHHKIHPRVHVTEVPRPARRSEVSLMSISSKEVLSPSWQRQGSSRFFDGAQ